MKMIKKRKSIEYIQEIVLQKKFYIPRVDELNDPLEGLCDVDFGMADNMIL